MTATTLAAAVAASDDSIEVDSFEDFPLQQFQIAINGEAMLVYDGFGTTTWSVLRDEVGAGDDVAVVDRFDRDVVDSWGATNEGIDWQAEASDASGNANVTSGYATLEIIAAGMSKGPALAHVDPLNVELRFEFMFDKLPTAGDAYVYARVRQQDSAIRERYRLRAQLETVGDLSVRLAYEDSGTTTVLGTNVHKVGYAAVDTWYWIALRAVGSAPTLLSGKVWKELDPEPAWDVTASDSVAAVQVPGMPALQATTQAGVSNAPIMFSFREFTEVRVGEGKVHALGDDVVLIEEWTQPIVMATGAGAPLSAPPTGAQYLQTDVEPPVLWTRVGSAWRSVTLT